MAQVRWGQVPAQLWSRVRVGLVGRHSQLAEHTSGFVECHGGVRGRVRIDPDSDHVSLLLKGCSDGGGTVAGNLSCRKHFTPLSSHADGGR